MPGVEVQERHEEVEADGGDGADDEVGEDVVAEGVGGGVGGDGLEGVIFELQDHDVEGREGGVGHDDGVGDHGGEEHAFGALGPVAHAEDELQADEQHAGVAEDDEDVFPEVVAEGVDLGVGETARDEVEGEVEVGEGEKGEQEGDELVDEFDVQEDLAGDGVVGAPDLAEVCERVDGGEEGTV